MQIFIINDTIITLKNNFNHINYKTFLLSVFVTLLLIPVYQVNADAWWGKGYKKPSWVKAHGGTIIYVDIIGKDKYDYKGILRRDGKYVEVEFDKRMLFDDAKHGLYTITFYDCGRDCRYQLTHDKTHIRDKDKKKFTIPIMARGGEDIHIIYDTDSDRAWLTSKAGSLYTPPTFTELTATRAKKQEGDFQTLSSKLFKNAQTDTVLLESKVL